MNANFRKFAARFALVFMLSLVLVSLINEGAYWLVRDENDRAPQTIELVIPAGTSELVAQGKEAASIPEELVFVVGDTLVVDNQDSTAHQLGPVWVPPKSRASLTLGEVNNFVYQCSFRPTKYLGLDVRSGTTIRSRITALFLAGPPTAMFFFIYSLLVFPIDGQKPAASKEKKSSEDFMFVANNKNL